MSPQTLYGRVLDALASTTSRARIVSEDEVRHELNGQDPALLLTHINQLERRVARIEQRLP